MRPICLLATLILCLGMTIRGHAADVPPQASPMLEKLQKKYGAGLLYQYDDQLKVLIATTTDRATLDEIRQTMTAHAAALQRDLFTHRSTDPIWVMVPDKWANPRVTGHFYGNGCDAATIGSDLRHEFTHAIYWGDQQARGQEHPVWLMEGFASLYEDSTIIDGHAVPRRTARIFQLQQDVARKKFVPFSKMLAFRHKDFHGEHYLQARFMLLYLYEQNKLIPFYEEYCANFKQDPTGAASLEKVLQKKLDAIQEDWVAWLAAITPPTPNLPRASLGVVTQQLPFGLRIERLLPSGGAAAAGLLAGDVILSLDEERTINSHDLTVALLPHKVGDKVQLRYRRADETRTATLTLTPMPDPTPASQPATR